MSTSAVLVMIVKSHLKYHDALQEHQIRETYIFVCLHSMLLHGKRDLGISKLQEVSWLKFIIQY